MILNNTAVTFLFNIYFENQSKLRLTLMMTSPKKQKQTLKIFFDFKNSRL